ncbi:hypothetical protein [Sinomonas sp.]|uniref:hypothetical protein n=1 Tax=Sinomonas sp. TaxID=1914986 RepID=UPI003F80F3B1
MSSELIEALLEEALAILETDDGGATASGDEAVFGLRAGGRPVRVIAADLRCGIDEIEEAIERARRRRPELRFTEDRIAWELHRAVAEKLERDGTGVIAVARRNLVRVRQEKRNSAMEPWVDEWASLLDGDRARLIETMLDGDEHAADLRRLALFAGTLSEAERLLAVRKAGLARAAD